MARQMVTSAKEAKKIMASIPKRVRRQDKRDFLEVVVKNHIVQLENDELEYNLRLQEKLNRILVEEIRRLRGICNEHGVRVEDVEVGADDFEVGANGKEVPTSIQRDA